MLALLDRDVLAAASWMGLLEMEGVNGEAAGSDLKAIQASGIEAKLSLHFARYDGTQTEPSPFFQMILCKKRRRTLSRHCTTSPKVAAW